MKVVECPFCNSTEIELVKNVGSDIDPSGCEDQHIDKCKCGAWRFHIDRYENFTEHKKLFGKWHEKDKDNFLSTVGC